MGIPPPRCSTFRRALLPFLVLASLLLAGGTASAAHAQDAPADASSPPPRWMQDALRLGVVRDAEDLRATLEDLREDRQATRAELDTLTQECAQDARDDCASERERLETRMALLDQRERNLQRVYGDLDRAVVALAADEGRDAVTEEVDTRVGRLSDARSARLDAEQRIVRMDADCGAEAARLFALAESSDDAMERERLRAQLAEHRDACEAQREPLLDERRALLREERASERNLSQIARSGTLTPVGDALGRVA